MYDRYGLKHTWPMMPGGMTITVDKLKELQMKYDTEKNINSKSDENGNSTIQWPAN